MRPRSYSSQKLQPFVGQRRAKLKSRSKYPRPQIIFVDVDGTLIFKNGEPNFPLIKKLWEKKSAGFAIVLWSFRGEEHAKAAAWEADCTSLFTHILGKPGFIVDDKGWTWIRYVGRMKVT